MRSVTDFDYHPPGNLTHPTPGDLCFANAQNSTVSEQDSVPANSNLLSPPKSPGGEEIPTEVDPFPDLHPELLSHWENAFRAWNGEAPETGFLFPCG